MPWTNWGEEINREEMLGFVKQIRNRCDVILQFKPQDYLLYTLLEDIYEDSQAVAMGYSAMTEDTYQEDICPMCSEARDPRYMCPNCLTITLDSSWTDTDCTGDE